jgi:pimeloyl-ACP methyl ester carboxylesterase
MEELDRIPAGKENGMSSKIIGALLIVGLFLVCAAAPSPPAARTGTVLSADSVSIGYSIDGDGSPALVFIHCWCCDRGYWRNQVPEFAKKYTVVTVDLAGHGESGMNRGDWTLDAFAADVAAVVRALDLERIILIGHSMGGPVALETALLLPGRVIGVVGVDTYQNFQVTFGPEQQRQFLAQFEGDFTGMTTRFVRSMFPATADSALVAWTAEDMSSAPPAVGIGAMRNLLAFDPKKYVSKIEVPIYAINSERFPTNVEGNKQLAPSFRAKFIPGVGHFIMLEDPGRFNRLLEETVEEIINQ